MYYCRSSGWLRPFYFRKIVVILSKFSQSNVSFLLKDHTQLSLPMCKTNSEKVESVYYMICI
jgi:hypothetical protein